MAGETKEVKKEPPVLGPNRMHLAEHARAHYVINVEQGTTREDITQPEYWSLHSKGMSPLDLIEARAEDGSFWALFLVLGCDRTWAKVHEVLWCDLTTQDVSLTQAQKYTVQWKGPQKKHCVIRSSDSAILFEGGQRKADAEEWLKNHEMLTAKA